MGAGSCTGSESRSCTDPSTGSKVCADVCFDAFGAHGSDLEGNIQAGPCMWSGSGTGATVVDAFAESSGSTLCISAGLLAGAGTNLGDDVGIGSETCSDTVQPETEGGWSRC